MAKKPDDTPAKYQPTKHDPKDARVHGMTAADKHDTRLRCPKDSTFMEKVMVGRIEIDRCAGCGAMWFDGMELERILAGYDTKSLKMIDIGATGRVSGGR